MARCLFPVFLKKSSLYVPCGRCLECRKRYVSNWSFRLMQEERVSMSSCFITLTYDDDSVYYTRNGYMGLDRRDLQLFFKRLRKAHTSKRVSAVWKRHVQAGVFEFRGLKVKFGAEVRKPIMYYAVGEYGGRTRRPHYHIILFNADIELIEDCWKMGSVHYGDVSGASVGYTLKYLCKPRYVGMGKNDDREPEFAVMSKGIGMSYLDNPAICEWHLVDMEKRMYVNVGNGKKAAMPRYIRERLFFEDEQRKIRDANIAFINERQLKVMETQTLREMRVSDAYKKHSNQLLIMYAEKGRNKI